MILWKRPCKECGALVWVKQWDRQRKQVAILCESCLALRVAAVKAARPPGWRGQKRHRWFDNGARSA